MDRMLLEQAERYRKKNRRKSFRHRLVRFLGCVVIFCTTYALILPAITQEKEPLCSTPEHSHSERCYIQVESGEQQVLTCTEPETQIHLHEDDCYALQPGHQHDDACYTLQTELICNMAEALPHTHGDDCYGQGETPVCSIVENHAHQEACYTPAALACEIREHVHAESCYGRADLSCSELENHVHDEDCYTLESLNCENTEEEHTHDAGCFTPRTLACDYQEGHVHGDGCYHMTLQCGADEHQHSDACWNEPELTCTEPEGHVHDGSCFERVLTCSLAETEGHAHAEDCYTQHAMLVCTQEETLDMRVLRCEIPEETQHIHSEACYAIVNDPTCGLAEDAAHTHTERCYGRWVRDCSMEAHTHTLICYSDKNADVESSSDWKRTFSKVKKSGQWSKDLIAIAKTQLGYYESTKNYIVLSDGVTVKGYTRYGDWYGQPYDDWSGMFASFCINYAGVKNMPTDANCQKWIDKLSSRKMFQKSSNYSPVAGDLVFFDRDHNGKADAVGIVTSAGGGISTIEGNVDNRVASRSYSTSDSTIVGYGVLPTNPDYIEIGEGETGVYDENGNLIYVIPAQTEAPTVEPTAEPTEEPTAEPTAEPTVEPTQEPLPAYLCGLDEHVHVDGCYNAAGDLLCIEPEHQHNKTCLTEPAPKEKYFCGLNEHVHANRCYDAKGALTCGKEEHQHDWICLIEFVPVVEHTPEPTAEPTAAPTAEPTAKPTAAPTAEPTAEPTATPTVEPTTEPVISDVVVLTPPPAVTEAPVETEAPVMTEAPTAEPTAEPTVEPTEEPTATPTAEPTAVPVISDVVVLTPPPAVTEAPAETEVPVITEAPTAEPTVEPTAEPILEQFVEVVEKQSPAYICGLDEHVHTVGCYDAEGKLFCIEAEHQHGEICLVESASEEAYFCGLDEHAHEERCYDAEGTLACLEMEHLHDWVCLIEFVPEVTYLCGLDEHVHMESCYDAAGSLLCIEVEHQHDERCLVEPAPETKYFCGMDEHTHAKRCYDAAGMLTCGKVEHAHDLVCLIQYIPPVAYACGLHEHAHDELCYDAEGNLICMEAEHMHDAACAPDEGCFCGIKAHVHGETCMNEAGELICLYAEHVHQTVCLMDMSKLSDDLRRQVVEVFVLIEDMPSADQIDERIMEFELVEDYEGEEAWLTEIYQLVSDVYHRYAALAPYAQEYVINRDKLLEMEYIWSAVPMVDTIVGKTISFNKNMFTSNARFVVYAQSGNDSYAFDGNGNAVPIIIEADGTIIANVNNKNELLWRFTKQSGDSYMIQNTATGRYMHAYPNNGSGVTTTTAYASTIVEKSGKVYIRSNTEYAYLNANNRVYSMTQSQNYAATFKFGVVYDCYVWLDGTNGGLRSLGGSPNTGYLITDGTFVLPETWTSPDKYAYTLRGWYDIINGKYYAPGEEIEVNENLVLYADWVAATYNIGQFNSHVADTESTNSFITTRVYDYSSIFNTYSLDVSVTVDGNGHSETWTMSTAADSIDYIFRDWDSTGKISYPRNTNADNTNGGVNSGLYNYELAEMLFGTGNSYNPQTGEGVLGKQYIGRGDHLFQYGDDLNEPEHYGYYYYDSRYNAASYSKSGGRFYVYDYLERTSDSKSNSRYADFLPFNSPYSNTNGKKVNTYTYSGELGEYNGVTHYEYDAKYNTDGDSVNNVGTNYWFGMKTDINFYLPSQPGTYDAEGGLANLSLHGDELVFEFTGDDDVWVLVDGKLTLDLGGIHGEESGSINFSTGVVAVNGSKSGSVTNLEPGEHTLTLLYLERGSSLSNCKIRFNLTQRYALTLQKEDVLTRELLNGAEFSVFLDAACTKPAELWSSEASYERGDAPTNVFVVRNGKAELWGLAASNTYYIKETKTPDGGYDFTRGIIVMQLNNKGVAAYDVIADGGSLTGGFTVHGYKVDQESQLAFMAITNGVNVTETTSITVRKRWNDDLNHDGDAVTVYLVVDGVRIREETLSAANDWKFTWENMPKYYQDGVTEVNYQVQEGKISGYVGGIERLTEDSRETTDWLQASSFQNGETYLIQSYEGYLAASGNKIYFIADKSTAEATPAARWKAKIDRNNLQLTNEAGQKLYYGDWRFRASSNPSASSTNLKFENGRFWYVRGNDKSYICNLASDGTLNAHTYDSAVIYTPYKLTTVYEDIPMDGFYYRITNSPVGEEETVSLTVNKVWDLGQLGTTAMYETLTIPVRLLENGVDTGMVANLSLKSNWKATFTGLLKYDSEGKLISYTVVEDWDSPEWSVRYGEVLLSGNAHDTYVTTITNTCTLTYMLPETGGCGTEGYTMGGLILIFTSGLLLLYRFIDKRRREVGQLS